MVREKIISTADNKDVPFMEFTICPAHRVAYKKEFHEKYGLDRAAYQHDGIYVNQTNAGKWDDLRNIFDTTTYDVDEILSWMIIRFDYGRSTDLKMDFNGNKYLKYIEITTKY